MVATPGVHMLLSLCLMHPLPPPPACLLCRAEWKPWAVPADYTIEMVEENNAIPSHIPTHIPAGVDISVFPPPPPPPPAEPSS